MNDFGNRLKEAIKRSGFSQKEIAKLLNLPEHTISRIVSGKNEPGVFKVVALANLLGVSLDWLLTGKESKKEDKSIRFHLHHLKGGTFNNTINTGIIANEPKNDFTIKLPPNITDNEIAFLLGMYTKLSKKNRNLILRIISIYLEEEKDE